MKKKYVIGVSMILVILVSVCIMFMNSFNILGNCGENMFAYTKEQTTGLLATGIIKDCGATTDFSTQVLIEKESIIILKGDYSKQCNINWSGSTTLNVVCQSVKESDIFLNKNIYNNNVQINFENK